MKIKTKVKNGLALDCRTVISFDKDEVLEVGDKGFSEENLKRLVELQFADLVVVEKAVVEEPVFTKKSKSKKKAKDEEKQGGDE